MRKWEVGLLGIWLGVLTGLGLLSGYMFEFRETFVFGFKWWQRLANFDGYHYFRIIKEGYSFGLSQSFFPGFPVLMKSIDWIVRGDGLILVGSVINLGLFLAGLVLLKRLVVSLGWRKEWEWVLLLVLSWPTSFYFISFYTESLFWFLSIVAFYWYLNKKTGPALLAAGLASGVRLVGIFLVVGFVAERLARLYSFKKLRGFVKFEVGLKMLAWVLIGGAGLWLYMSFLHIRFGDALMFFHNQSKFLAGRETGRLVLLPQVFYRYVKMFLTTPVDNPIFFVLMLEVWTSLLVMAGLVKVMIKRLPVSLWVYGWASLILPTLTGTLSSMPRYTLVIFPAFLGLSVLPKKAKWVIVGVNLVLLIIAWMRFFQGWWVA